MVAGGFLGHPAGMRFRALLILCGAVLIGACDEKDNESSKSAKLSAPEPALAGRRPDLGRADYRSQRGRKAADALAAAKKDWFGAGQPRPLVASASPESLGDRWRMKFDGARRTSAFTPRRTSTAVCTNCASFRKTGIRTAVYRPSERTQPETSGNLVAVALQGPGYRFLSNAHHDNYGTSAMASGIKNLAAVFARSNPGHPGLTFGDISNRVGGDIGHLSHRKGRDIDMYFAITDANGRPVHNNRRIRFNADGGGRHGFRFDDQRNWQLVKLMLENPQFGREVQFIFISTGLEKRILDAGRRAGAAPRLLARAQAVMRYEPGHTNHFHLRIKPAPRSFPTIRV